VTVQVSGEGAWKMPGKATCPNLLNTWRHNSHMHTLSHTNTHTVTHYIHICSCAAAESMQHFCTKTWSHGQDVENSASEKWGREL